MEQSIQNHRKTQHEANVFNDPILLVGSYRLHRGPRSASAPQYANLVDERKAAKFLLSPKSLRDRVDRSNQTSGRGMSAAEGVRIHRIARELDAPDLSLISHSSPATLRRKQSSELEISFRQPQSQLDAFE